MTKKEAILKSIKHWEKNVRKLQKGENLSFDDICAEACPLCLKYASFKGFSMECGKCPLAKIDCCNSPDSTWREVKEKRNITSSRKMIKVLKSLLKEEVK